MSLSVRLALSCRASYQTAKFHPFLNSRFPTSTRVIRPIERYVNGFSGPSPGQIGPQGEEADASNADEKSLPTSKWSPTFFKMFESAATTFASILVLA